MDKSTATRIGDVFCVVIAKVYKCYFQYVGKETCQFKGALIRMFRKHYPLDAEPSMAEVTAGEIAFHTLINITDGIYYGAWYKVGTATVRDKDSLKNIVFGRDKYSIVDNATKETCSMNPFENWYVRYFNCNPVYVGVLPDELKNVVEMDGVHTPVWILYRIIYGYFNSEDLFYSAVKRVPWPEIQTYVTRKYENTGDTHYYHFQGEKAVREVVVNQYGRIIRLSTCQHECDGFRLYAGDFGDIWWHYWEFITPEKFESMWNMG